ncbi:hypothetical protein ALC57_05611 [Trachymyrmex cornetzi]|uniref:DUF4817 domain-containing protein n=1 Tax=Trachymyrmex cornetzi TaxID=471704 RepID=A0A151JAT7_9HYME|nr:hypothetical protein ALC57_05611 [Trachymyrmex cornetzi]
MPDYTLNEIIDIVLVLGECYNNYRQAAVLYRNRFPHRQHPNHCTISRFILRQRQRQRQKRQRRHINVPERDDPTVLAVLGMTAINPRILEFCRWAQIMLNRDRTFFRFVLFSDEATFHNTGQLNKKPTTRENMMERITLTCRSIPRNILLSTVDSFERRVQLCVDNNGRDLHMIFRGLSKVKSMAPSYVALQVKQLLSETFLSTGFSFRDIWLDHLKWDTLYIKLIYE